MAYFTVKMVSKKTIVSFDVKGVKTGERTELIPQTYHDLPHVTALAYKTKFPDNQVEIIAQHGEFGGQSQIGGSRNGHRGAAAYSKRPTSWGTDTNRKVAQKQVDANDERQRAALTGDMAAAINAEIGS